MFTANHQTYGQSVLKLFKPGAADRVDRELEAVARVRSPNIPAVFETGTISSPTGPLVWLTEQWIEGTTLSALIGTRPFSGQEILHIADGLLTAAVAAEKAHVVHRDIKPANVLIDTAGDAWLLDFGIARLLDMDSKTRTDARYGPHSPGYGAPEQFRNRKAEIAGRTDLFAIGVLLYEVTTGQNPFLNGARDRPEILNRVETMPLPRLDLSWDPSRGFSDFVAALTQKQPYRRPRTCQDAYDWLHELMADLGG